MNTKTYTVDIEYMGIIHEVNFEVAISPENVVVAIMPGVAMDYWSDQDPETGVSEPHEEEADFFGYSATIQKLLYEELEEKLLADHLDCCVVIEGEVERL